MWKACTVSSSRCILLPLLIADVAADSQFEDDTMFEHFGTSANTYDHEFDDEIGSRPPPVKYAFDAVDELRRERLQFVPRGPTR